MATYDFSIKSVFGLFGIEWKGEEKILLREGQAG